jgi:hypothetical protein
VPTPHDTFCSASRARAYSAARTARASTSHNSAHTTSEGRGGELSPTRTPRAPGNAAKRRRQKRNVLATHTFLQSYVLATHTFLQSYVLATHTFLQSYVLATHTFLQSYVLATHTFLRLHLLRARNSPQHRLPVYPRGDPEVELEVLFVHCSGRKPPFWAVKRALCAPMHDSHTKTDLLWGTLKTLKTPCEGPPHSAPRCRRRCAARPTARGTGPRMQTFRTLRPQLS